MRGRGDKDQPDTAFAYELSGQHVGELIRFRTRTDGRETVAIVTGELRQLSINGAEVHILIGVGAEEEHTLAHGDRVIRRPAEDYSDVASLLGNDPEFAQWGERVL